MMKNISSAVGDSRSIPSPATSLREENRPHLIEPPLAVGEPAPARRGSMMTAALAIAAGAILSGGLMYLILKERRQ